MKLSYTRAMIEVALSGRLKDIATKPDAVFGLHVPASVRGVPDEVLDPRRTWADGAAYDAQAKKLAGMFRENFDRFAQDVSDEVRAAGPK